MQENIITFNITNWITVVIMAAFGFAVLGYAQKLYQSKMASSQGA